MGNFNEILYFDDSLNTLVIVFVITGMFDLLQLTFDLFNIFNCDATDCIVSS